MQDVLSWLGQRSPRVLVISTYSPLSNAGGIQTSLFSIFQHAAQHARQLHFDCVSRSFGEDGTPAPDTQVHYATVPSAKDTEGTRHLFSPDTLRFQRAVRRLLPRADLVHLHTPTTTDGFLAALQAHRLRKPLLITYYTGDDLYRDLPRLSRAKTNLVFSVLKSLRAMVTVVSKNAAGHIKLPSLYVSSFSAPICNESPPAPAATTTDRLKDGRPVIHVGGLEPRKNQLTSLKALHVLRRDHGSARPVLGLVYSRASREYQDQLKAYADRHRLAECIRWVRDIPYALMHGLYRETAQKKGIMVMPSTGEGLPLALLEAMGNRIPVVATRRDGMQDIIEHGRNGFLVDDPQDHATQAELVRALLADDALYASMAAEALKTAQALSVDRHVNKLLVAYAHLLGGPLALGAHGLPYVDGVIDPLTDHLAPGHAQLTDRSITYAN